MRSYRFEENGFCSLVVHKLEDYAQIVSSAASPRSCESAFELVSPQTMKGPNLKAPRRNHCVSFLFFVLFVVKENALFLDGSFPLTLCVF